MRRFCFQCLLFVLPIVVAAQFPAGYYNHAEGKKKAELKAVLKDIICNANVLNYGSGVGATWSGFYYTDRTEEGYCMDRYCDEWRQFNSSTEAVPGMNIEPLPKVGGVVLRTRLTVTCSTLCPVTRLPIPVKETMRWVR